MPRPYRISPRVKHHHCRSGHRHLSTAEGAVIHRGNRHGHCPAPSPLGPVDGGHRRRRHRDPAPGSGGEAGPGRRGDHRRPDARGERERLRAHCAGTVRGSNYVYVTVGEDPNVYESFAYKGDWAAGLNPQPAGTLPICAEVRDAAGAVLARDCVDYTRPVDPVYFQVISPAQDEEVSSTFTSVVACHGGSTVRMTLDGVSEVLPCDDYVVYRRYVDLVEGSHTLTVEMLALDGTTVVASETRTFTSARDPGRHRRHHLPRRRCHRLVDGAHRHRDRFLQRLPGSPGVRRRRVRRRTSPPSTARGRARSPCRSAPAGSAPR